LRRASLMPTPQTLLTEISGCTAGRDRYRLNDRGERFGLADAVSLMYLTQSRWRPPVRTPEQSHRRRYQQRPDDGRVHKDREAPNTIETKHLTNLMPSSTVAELLVSSGLAPSKSSALRLIDQHGVRINNSQITANVPISTVAPSAGPGDGELLVQVGKRNYLRVILR